MAPLTCSSTSIVRVLVCLSFCFHLLTRGHPLKQISVATSTNEGEIEFIEITDETVTASLNAAAHTVFSKERFMTKCKVIKANEPKSSFKNNSSTQN
jgi:hypothetical protein